jgi:hypothetical protein
MSKWSWLRENDASAAPITQSDLNKLEVYADRLFSKVGIDIEFTRHFLDRVNDERNKRQITLAELTRLFKQEFKRWGKAIAQMGPDAQAVMKDMKTDINMPFVLVWDNQNNDLDLIAKTVMRKKNFMTPNKEYPVESVQEGRVDIPDTPAKLSIYADDNRKTITLNKIIVPKDARSAGEGTRVMNKLTAIADKKGYTIVLDPSADFGGNKNRLIKFYKRFGFVENKGRNKDYEISEYMYRLPNTAVTEGVGIIVPGVNTTADVKAGETKRQAKKLGMTVNSKNEPKELHPKARRNSNNPNTMFNLGITEGRIAALDKPTPTVNQIALDHGVSVEFIKQQLKHGIEVEYEHTSDRDVAREIALDHLAELPDYYDRLDTIEHDHAISETLKQVNGVWAVVSKKNPSKVLQYYNGKGKPSDEWVKSVEKRVYSFDEASLNEIRDISRFYTKDHASVDPGDLDEYLDEAEPAGFSIKGYKIYIAKDNSRDFHLLVSNNKPFGSEEFDFLGIMDLYRTAGMQHMTSIKLAKELHGKGLAVPLYLAAMKKYNITLISDSQQSKGGQHIWAKLAKHPQVDVFVQYKDTNSETKYKEWHPEDTSSVVNNEDETSLELRNIKDEIAMLMSRAEHPKVTADESKALQKKIKQLNKYYKELAAERSQVNDNYFLVAQMK